MEGLRPCEARGVLIEDCGGELVVMFLAEASAVGVEVG